MQEMPPDDAPSQRADHSEFPVVATTHSPSEEEEATTVGGGASGLGLVAMGEEPEVGPPPVMLELDEAGTVIAKLNAIPEEVLGTVGGDAMVLNSSRGILDVIPEEEQLGSPTGVEGGGAVGVVSEQAEGEKVAAEVESGGRVVEGDPVGVTEGSGVTEESGVMEESGEGTTGEESGVMEESGEGTTGEESGVMEESGEGTTGEESGVMEEESGVGVTVENSTGEGDTAEGGSAGVTEEAGVMKEGSRGETVGLSEVPAIITSEENEQPKETEEEVLFSPTACCNLHSSLGTAASLDKHAQCQVG